jgi:hypothetical protein
MKKSDGKIGIFLSFGVRPIFWHPSDFLASVRFLYVCVNQALKTTPSPLTPRIPSFSVVSIHSAPSASARRTGASRAERRRPG